MPTPHTSETRILFIVPPYLTFENFIHPAANVRHVQKRDGHYYGALTTDMPLGVLSLSAYAKKHCPNLTTHLIDFNIRLNNLDGFPFHSFADYFTQVLTNEMAGFNPDIVAISSLFSPSYFNLLAMGACCRKLFPTAILVAGGNVPSSIYQEIYKQSDDFDALCYGEGEKPLVGLIQADQRIPFLESHPSWITLAKVRAGTLFQHDFIENLDEIPFHDYALCEMDQYGKNSALTAYSGVQKKLNNFHVMSSRGCPFKCVFCAAHKVHGRDMRYYSLARVEEDLIRLRDEYGASGVVFQDDHLMGDKKRALAIVHLVRSLYLDVVFQNGLAIYGLDRTMLEALRQAGVGHLNLSVESGSERVLKHIMRKPLKLSMVEPVIQNCRELGIYTEVNILIGLPGETKQDIADTRQFLRGIHANWYMIFCASPLVGSDLYDICVEKNYLKEGHIGSDYKKAVIETEEFTAEYIQEMAYFLNLELNFVENKDVKLGQYHTALRGFENAIRSKHDHAIAYACASHCYEKLGDLTKAEEYRAMATEICRNSDFWRYQFTRFNLPLE